MIGIIWIVSIIATLIIVNQKNLSGGLYLFLSILAGPLAVIIALAESPREIKKVDELPDTKEQLRELRSSFFTLQRKVDRLETLINKLTGEETTPSIPKAEIADEQFMETAGSRGPADLDVKQEAAAPSQSAGADMEINFGRNWLNKIGIVVFTLGMGFLISYTFKYFGPFLKIAFGYSVSAILFFAGFKLEAKERLVNFGRALLGGGWALVYFTTYAMHHFEASRIIGNEFADLCLLAVVAAGMMMHALRYKSEGMMSVALFVAYITATLGQITVFTFASSVLLAVVILFLVYKLQWVRTFVLGVILTYGIHYIWVAPNIMATFNRNNPDYMMMNFIFLTLYWLVFLIGVHMAKTVKDSRLVNILAGTNFGNIALYCILAYPLVLKLFYEHRFFFVLGAGILYLGLAPAMKRMGREKLYISDVVAAVFLITFSIPLKFLPTSTLLLWLVEIPFLLFIGLNFKEKIFRYLSYALSLLVGTRLILWGVRWMPDVSFLGVSWTWQEFMFFWAGVAMAVCFYLTRRGKAGPEFDEVDKVADHAFPAASCAYFTALIFSSIQQPWITFVLSWEAIALMALSVILGLMRFRAYAYVALVSAGYILAGDHVDTVSNFLKWGIIGTDVMAFFATYFIVKYLGQGKKADLIFPQEEIFAFWGGIVLLIFVVFEYVHSQWITLTLGVAGMVFILGGIWDKDKTERLGGLVLLALTLGRVFLVDLAGLDVVFKIITFIVLGILFLGISFVYNRFSIEKE